ncbi:MAG: M14 family zinc carboxypeptidase, partial [Gemmatimonadaceae bacterium]
MRSPVGARTLLRNAFIASSLLGIVQSRAHAQRGLVPTPESILGFTVGADFKLATYDESMKYFSALAASSNRVKLIDVGRTATGHAWTLVLISSPENLANIARLKEIAQRLAHPENLTDAQARALAREGKAFVDISGGLHASEIAGSQHTIQLAYDIVAHPDSAPIKAILDNTVLLLWPSINPDGQNIVVNWYRENVGTPYEVSPLHELYQKYVGHDNNRDGYMLNVVESRVVARTWREWEPQIIYVQHQVAPFPTRIWLPPFAEPIAPRVAGLMSREVNTIGMTIAQQL